MPDDDRDVQALGEAERSFRAGRWDEAIGLCAALVDGSGVSAQTSARAAYWAGRACRRDDRLDEALRWLYRGVARGVEDSVLDCRLQAELVHVTSNLGDNDEALVMADALLTRAARYAEPIALALAHDAHANVLWRTFDWERGRRAFEVALRHAREGGDVELVCMATMGLAGMQEEADGGTRGPGVPESPAHARRALELQRQAVRLAADFGDVYLLAFCELNEACILHSLSLYGPAERILRRILDTPSAEAVHGHAMIALAQVYRDRGDLETALVFCRQSLRRLEGSRRLYPLVCVHELLVGVHEALGDHREALAAMRRYHDLFVRNAGERAAARAAALTVRHDTERALAEAEAERERADRLERWNAALAHEAAENARAAELDDLTGVANRRGFDAALGRLLSGGPGADRCSVALVDVDRFKDVNDRFGHRTGDEVLRRVAALVQRCTRPGDVVARYGGDEFVVLVRVPAGSAPAFGERVREAVEGYDWDRVAPGLLVTVSIGLAGLEEVADDAGPGPHRDVGAGLLDLADDRLYAAKRAVRNLVVPAADAGPTPLTDPRGLPFP